MHIISENVVVIDGYVVLKVDGEREDQDTRRLVKKFNMSSKLFDQDEKNLLSEQELIDIDEYHGTHPESDLVPVRSQELFQYCTVVQRSFYPTEEGYKIVNLRTPTRFTKIAQVYAVIPVHFKNKPTKYLYSKNAQLAMDDDLDLSVDRSIVHSKDSSFFEQEMNVGELHFTPADLHILRQYHQVRAVTVESLYEIFLAIYLEVRNKFQRRVFKGSFFDQGYGEAFPKDMQIPTIQKYCALGASFVFLAEVLPQLSFAADMDLDEEPPKSVDSLTTWFTKRLMPRVSESDTWIVLLRVCCYDWQNMLHAYPVVHTLNGYRQLVDSIRALATYSVLYRSLHPGAVPGDSQCDQIFFGVDSEAWTWTNVMYHKLIMAYQNYTKFNIKGCPPDACVISGRRFSRSYIREFYANVRARFDANIAKLRVWYEHLLGVKAVADACLNTAATSDLVESRVAPRESLLLLFPHDKLLNVLPVAKPGLINADEVAKVAADMGVCVMWMIYFSATGPYRFPDMLILKYAGNQRNVFVDSESRCMEVITEYSKTRQANPMCKTLDKVTSDYLFYLILVVRTILKNALTGQYDRMRRDLFNETSDVEEAALLNGYLARSVGGGAEVGNDGDARRYTRNVLNSFVFVDCSIHALVNYPKFSSFLSIYPESAEPSMRLPFREMRHGMIKLVRDYVKVEGEDMSAMVAKEQLAGHSAATGQRVYGVEHERGVATGASVEEKYASLINAAWHHWLGLGRYDEGQDGESAIAFDPAVQRRYFHPNGSIRDLFAAGRKLYGREFEFREGQYDVAVEVYLSGTQVIPIQALPGFGKTALFQLPLVALSLCPQKTVSFVFVPYVCLESNMQIRLSAGGTTCGAIKDLFAAGPAVEQCHLFCDVYVGTFNDLSSAMFVRLVNSWYSVFEDIVLGMIVIDEFHNLETEQCYRGRSFKLIPEINFSLAWKVVVMTGTARVNGMKKPMRFIGYETGLTTSLTAVRSRILYFDMVSHTPLGGIVKTFTRVRNCDAAEDMVEDLVARMMRYDACSKVIVVCSRKVTVESLHFQCAYEWVHGDLPADEKVRRSKRFIEDPGCRVLVGTKLVSEGIDIRAVKLVILVDYLPTVGEYIQTAGRLREGGVCMALWSPAAVDRMGIQPSVCPLHQISKFYGLTYQGHDLCCDHHQGCPPDVWDLYQYLNGEGEGAGSAAGGSHMSLSSSSSSDESGPDRDGERVPLIAGGAGSNGNSNDVGDATSTSDEPDPSLLPVVQLLPFEVAPNKRRRVQSLKEELASVFGGTRDVFDFIGIPPELAKKLYFYGLNESCLAFPLSSADDPCPGCLGPADGGCVCWDGEGPSSVRRFGFEMVYLLKLILPEREFDCVRKECLDKGLHALMLRCARTKSRIIERFQASHLVPFCAFMVKNPKWRIAPSVFEDDMAMATLYNRMWETLKDGQLDVLLFFSQRGRALPLPALWEESVEEEIGDDVEVPQRTFRDLEPSIRMYGLQRYRQLAFVTEFGGRLDYLLSVCGFCYQPYMLKYSQDADAKSRHVYVPSTHARRPPTVEVPEYQYVMMLFAMFHNQQFVDIVYGQFPQMSRVRCFSHWLRLMTLSVQFPRNQGRRLYLVVGAMYFMYARGSR